MQKSNDHGVPTPSWCIYSTKLYILCIRFGEYCGRREGKTDCKRQGTRKAAVRCVSYKWQETCVHEISTVRLPQQNLNNGNANRHANVEVGISHAPLLHKELQAITNCWERENLSFSEMNPLIGYPIPSGQLWNHVHTSNIKWNQQAVFLYLCIYAYKE